MKLKIKTKTNKMLISFKQNPAPIPPLIDSNSNAVEWLHPFKILMLCLVI